MPTLKSTVLSLLAATLLPGLLSAADWNRVSLPPMTHPSSGQVFYFVLTDRFANGDSSNDTGHLGGGRDQHGFDPSVISHYHGGDFRGLSGKLDYLKGLGVSAIWITPPFRNKPVQEQSAGYHGYWILDFTTIDPHLGTEAEFRNFVDQAHARGLRVFLDIVVNHTADVIHFKEGSTHYRDIASAPYRDAQGRVFDAHTVAWNGLGDPSRFPKLDTARSFAYTPVVPREEAQAKAPAWLNDPIYYHNRGNSLFREENSLHGDFVGLDDVFTENPAVARGFTDVYESWIRRFGVDGFRIDTAKHVNLEFWQAFGPAIRSRAKKLGKTEFFQFGEVADDKMDVPLLSTFSTEGNLDSTLDFGFFEAVRRHVSKGEPASVFSRLFALDDFYTDHDSNAIGTPTFVSNHDAGRFGWFLRSDNAGLDDASCAQLVLLAHGLLLSARGQPVLYYGDEQGMAGTGNDMAAREDMFPSQAKGFRELGLLATQRRGSDDKFDTRHPFYRELSKLAELRRSSPGLARGATLPRETGKDQLLAFSRIERGELIEYLAVFNSSRKETLSSELSSAQGGSQGFEKIYDSTAFSGREAARLEPCAQGKVKATLAPMQFALWKAKRPLTAPQNRVALSKLIPADGSILRQASRTIDGHTLPSRIEISAEVDGGDGVAEISFFLRRETQPEQLEVLGTDDAAPYRVFWTPPADLKPGERFDLIATVDDLRGHKQSRRVEGLSLAPDSHPSGIQGAKTPLLSKQAPESLVLKVGAPLRLSLAAEGSGELEYRWFRDGRPLPAFQGPELSLEAVSAADAGHYQLLVHNLQGSVLSREIVVEVRN